MKLWHNNLCENIAIHVVLYLLTILANETSHCIIMITISYNVYAISDISWYGIQNESDHALICKVIFGKKRSAWSHMQLFCKFVLYFTDVKIKIWIYELHFREKFNIIPESLNGAKLSSNFSCVNSLVLFHLQKDGSCV